MNTILNKDVQNNDVFKKIDLHIHSTYSDGSSEVEEILEQAYINGIKTISICDHDTVEGSMHAMKTGKYDICAITGVEISCFDKISNKKVHILGYNFKSNAPNITKICHNTLMEQNKLSIWQIEQLINVGYNIDLKQVEKKLTASNIIYKQHIMDVLIDNKYTDKIYSSLYKALFKNEGICCKTIINYPDVKDAIEAIHKDGGVAVLAHPGVSQCWSEVSKYVMAGLDGIETYHSSHNKIDIDKSKELAVKYKLLETGGSDFHGKYGDEPPIGLTPLLKEDEVTLRCLMTK